MAASRLHNPLTLNKRHQGFAFRTGFERGVGSMLFNAPINPAA